MKKVKKWFFYDATLRAKIITSLAILQGIGLIFFGVYATSVCRIIIEKATVGMDEDAKLEIIRFAEPALVSFLLLAIALFLASMHISFKLTGLLSERIKRIQWQADAVANGDLKNIPETDAKDEIGTVINSVHKMSETLTEKVEEARMANESKSNFLARMSHDIRTPMNAIRGMVEIVKKDPDDKERVADCLKKIDVSTNHLLVLIDEILDMSKLEGGELEITTDSFDFAEVLNQCCEVASGQGDERNITVFCDTSEITVTKVLGCELYTRRIITNLLNNALKFNKDGGHVAVEVSQNVFENKRIIYQLIIEDTGIGMSREFMDKAFEPFTQEEAGARTTYKGTGLGLAIVKKLLEAMGGHIEAESEMGEGTRFVLNIPFQMDTPDITPAMERAETLDSDVAGSRMLLVEDNELNMEIAKFMLEDKGITVDTAENGLVAVKKFDQSLPFTYDLILMDIMMPEMDGIEATRRIRNLQRADAKIVPIVALSANTYAEDIKASKDSGMNDHLAKPIDVERLYDVITRQKKHYDAKRIEKPYSQLFTGDALK